MPWFRILLFPALAVPPLLLTGALSRTHPAPAPAPAVPPPVADPAAAQLLERAIGRLQPGRMPWVHADVWQKVMCEDFTYQAEGELRTGPGRRLRLDLEVHLGRCRGKMEVVCDGTTLWQSTQVDGAERQVSRINVRLALQALARPQVPSQIRADFLGYQGFAGLAPLLQDLQRRMVPARKEATTWNGQKVTRLALVWSPSEARNLAPPEQPWPAYLPRMCFVYLDPATLWPRRLEFWGPGGRGGKDFPILQMEFHPRELNHPLTREQSARAFAFDPGRDEVPDSTREVIEILQEATRGNDVPGRPEGS